MGHFCPPGSGSTDPIESGSNPDTDPDPVRIRIRIQSGYGSGSSPDTDPDPQPCNRRAGEPPAPRAIRRHGERVGVGVSDGGWGRSCDAHWSVHGCGGAGPVPGGGRNVHGHRAVLPSWCSPWGTSNRKLDNVFFLLLCAKERIIDDKNTLTCWMIFRWIN